MFPCPSFPTQTIVFPFVWENALHQAGHDERLKAMTAPVGVHAESVATVASAPASLSLRLSTFPTSRFHCEDCNWFPAAFPRRAEGSVQLYVRA